MSYSVCIVTPGSMASNPRAVKEAMALQSAGYRVTVVTGGAMPFLDTFDQAMASAATWDVRRGGATLFNRVSRRLWLAIARRWRQLGQKIPLAIAVRAFSEQTPALTRSALEVEADLYIAHYVPALPAAARAAERHGAMLGFDAEDFHPGESVSSTDIQNELIGTIDAAFLGRCVHLTAASPLIAKAYGPLCAKTPEVVLNVFPLADRPARRSTGRSVGRKDGLRAYWFSQTIGLDRGLQAFIQAMARARSRVSLDIRGNDPWGHGAVLLAEAARLGIADRVRLLPLAAPEKMVEVAADYDLGISFEVGETESRRYCLTNKIFTYLLGGLPILMSATPAQASLAADLGDAAAVVSLTDVDSIARQLDLWGLSPDALDRAGARAWQLGQERYNWDVEQRAFLASVKSAFEGRRMTHDHSDTAD